MKRTCTNDIDALTESILSINLNAINKEEKELPAIELQKRINAQYCAKTYDALSDIALQKEYVKTKGFAQQNRKLESILKRHVADNKTIDIILAEYTAQLVSPSVKSAVRGAEFNRLVKEFLLDLKLPKYFDIQFEKPLAKISERPDWYIIANGKTLIGMNQMDLWGGGHQLNRGDKYINQIPLSDNERLICVVCNKIDISNKRRTTKVFQIVEKGIRTNAICYLGGLKKLIYEYFNLN